MSTSPPGLRPTIRVEDATSPQNEDHDHRRNSASSSKDHRRPSRGRSRSNERRPSSSSDLKHSSHTSSHSNHSIGSPGKAEKKRKSSTVSSQAKDSSEDDAVHTHLGGHSMLAKLQPNLHMRRKSSPAITGLDSRTLSQLHTKQKRHSNQAQQLFVNSPSASQIASRRLSSPPSLDKDQEDFFFSHHYSRNRRKDCDNNGTNATGSNSDSGSSLNKLSISGLNPSSSDLRSNTIISGHQNIGTLFAPNNMTYPESISINLLNAPGDSTVQCDCGHINCPFCNLMMNLELTDH